jgi:hypothetical protein
LYFSFSGLRQKSEQKSHFFERFFAFSKIEPSGNFVFIITSNILLKFYSFIIFQQKKKPKMRDVNSVLISVLMQVEFCHKSKYFFATRVRVLTFDRKVGIPLSTLFKRILLEFPAFILFFILRNNIQNTPQPLKIPSVVRRFIDIRRFAVKK